MRFLNLFSVLCRKTFSYSVKLHCKSLHCDVFSHDLFKINARKQQKIHLISQNYANFHCSARVCAKSYPDTENELAHEVLQVIPSYDKSTVKLPKTVNMEDFSTCNIELAEFAKVTMDCISLNICLDDGPYFLPVSNLLRCLPSLSNENLLKCFSLLGCLPSSPKFSSTNFIALWKGLDLECVRRLPDWDTSQKLLVADYWFHIKLNRASQYNRKMIESVLMRLNEVTDTEIVQLMFYINIQKELPCESLKNVEERLVHMVKTISIGELGIVCLGFFKTQNKLNDISIIKVIIERFINEIENAKLSTLVALLKILKRSMNFSYVELYIPLLHKCLSYTSKWNVITCVHLALLTAECQIYDPLLLDSISNRIHSLIETARLKDMVKLLQCLSRFNHPPSQEITDSIFSELQKETRQAEIASKPRDLIYLALYYSYFGYYNYTLLNTVLDVNFAQNCILRFPESDVIFAEVDSSTDIECKDYTGNRLGRPFWKVLERRREDFDLKNQYFYNRLMNEILSTFNSKDNVHVKHVLPHTCFPEIIIQLSGDKKTLSSSRDFLLPRPKSELWVALVMGVPNSFAYGSKHKTGLTAKKIRLLEKLGYKAILIPYDELPRGRVKRIKYLEQKLKML